MAFSLRGRLRFGGDPSKEKRRKFYIAVLSQEIFPELCHLLRQLLTMWGYSLHPLLLHQTLVRQLWQHFSRDPHHSTPERLSIQSFRCDLVVQQLDPLDSDCSTPQSTQRRQPQTLRRFSVSLRPFRFGTHAQVLASLCPPLSVVGALAPPCSFALVHSAPHDKLQERKHHIRNVIWSTLIQMDRFLWPLL